MHLSEKTATAWLLTHLYMRGFKLTGIETDPRAIGGDLDIYTKAVDHDDIVRDAIVLVIRTRVGEWYYNPSRGRDPQVANLSPNDEDIRATLEADLADDLALITGFSLDSVTCHRMGTTRTWRVTVKGRTVRPLTVTATVET